jgi:V-type H+-transporting ATPase subunit d
MSELAFFNVQNGFTESLVRGLRSGFLAEEDIRRIKSADTLEDVRTALEETDYGTFLQDEPSGLQVNTIFKKCYERLADEFTFVKAQSTEPLTTFLDFMQREKMIDNVIMIIQSALNGKAPADMQEKIHPLGVFESLRDIMKENFDVNGGFDEVYQIFLQDTPVGPYFKEYLEVHGGDSSEERTQFERSQVGSILSNKDLEIMKAYVKKIWLHDFYDFVMKQGGTTAEVMGHMLKVEADNRVILVVLNSLKSGLNDEAQRSERSALFPTLGYLYPEGYGQLRMANTSSMVKTALDPFGEYAKLYEEVNEFYSDEKSEKKASMGEMLSIEDVIYKLNAREYELAFEQQFHFGVFYAWVKLREQEIRNIRWICNMIVLQEKDKIDSTIIPIFPPQV